MPLRLAIRPVRAPAADRPAAEHELVLDEGTAILGRGPQANVRLPEAAVSLSHARLERTGDDWFITDVGSTNGTRLNGTRLVAGQRRLLRPGDRIEVPGFAVLVGSDAAAAPTTPEGTVEIARRMVHEVLLAVAGADESAPTVTVLNGPQAGVVLTLGEIGRAYRLGRAESCELILGDRDASREHATLRRDFTGVTLTDLGAKNGVMVGRARLTGPRVLGDGDEIVIGATQLRFSDPAEAYLRKLESLPEVAAATPAPAPAAATPGLAPAPAAPGLAPAAPGLAPAAPGLAPAAPGLAPAVDASALDAPAPGGHDAPGPAAAPAPRRALGPLLIAVFAAVLALVAAGGLVLLLRST
ncbi:MAG TPA: FHA domain-containing protein [Polyangia bacterium]